MKPDVIPVSEAVGKSLRFWFLECAIWAGAWSCVGLLIPLVRGAKPMIALLASSAGIAFAGFFCLALLLQVGVRVFLLNQLINEFGYTLSREQYRPKDFAGRLVSGEYAKILEQMRRERKAGIR